MVWVWVWFWFWFVVCLFFIFSKEYSPTDISSVRQFYVDFSFLCPGCLLGSIYEFSNISSSFCLRQHLYNITMTVVRTMLTPVALSFRARSMWQVPMWEDHIFWSEAIWCVSFFLDAWFGVSVEETKRRLDHGGLLDLFLHWGLLAGFATSLISFVLVIWSFVSVIHVKITRWMML